MEDLIDYPDVEERFLDIYPDLYPTNDTEKLKGQIKDLEYLYNTIKFYDRFDREF